MIDMNEVVRQMSANAEAIQVLLQTEPESQAQWKPDPETWSLKEVMAHIYNEERIDFRKHLKEMLNVPSQPWEAFREDEIVPVESARQALEGFMTEREASITWLRTLEAVDWDTVTQAPWGRPISAGDVLVSWVEHDFLHMRQIIEVLHAINVQQAAPYSVQYAGGW